MAQQEREGGWTWTVLDPERQRLEAEAARTARLASVPSTPERTPNAGETDESAVRSGRFRFVWATGEYVNVVPERGEESREHTHSVRVEDGEATACSCREDADHSDPCEHRQAVETELLA